MKQKLLEVLLWLKNEDSGQDLIEYALLVAFLGLALMAVMPPVATALEGVFNKAITCLNSGTSCTP